MEKRFGAALLTFVHPIGDAIVHVPGSPICCQLVVVLLLGIGFVEQIVLDHKHDGAAHGGPFCVLQDVYNTSAARYGDRRHSFRLYRQHGIFGEVGIPVQLKRGSFNHNLLRPRAGSRITFWYS